MAEFGAAISQHPEPAPAVGEVTGAVLEAVGFEPDVAVLFVNSAHAAALEEIAGAVRVLLKPGVLIGATAASVIGGPLEIEDEPAIALWAGRVGACEPVRLQVRRGPEGAAVSGMPDAATLADRTLLLLADPFSFPTEALIGAVRGRHPDLVVVGGLASAGGAGANRLVLDHDVHDDGAVGALLPRGVEASVVVSQGCRPVGDPFIVTAAHDDTIVELGSRPALDRLGEVVDAADDEERALLARGLHVGIVVDESKSEFARGDFLIRAVTGADHAAGTLRVGDRVPVGTTLQFHVRDAAAADDDLRSLLERRRGVSALVFTCNGRGTGLFGAPDHDAGLVSAAVGDGPVAGMFCAGEVGPVGGVNHIHGFTASILLFGG